jgi:16S rRNA (uracil1498-N3)-methyltransferase
MPRLYIPDIHILDGQISITGEKVRYLTSVLRCRKGDELIVFDGKGGCLRTMILKADRKEVITAVMKKFPCNTESPINITLVQGILKGEKMDLVVQKVTELGVTEIIPVVTERSQLRETRKAARWKKIAEEASRQSGRSVIPIIHEPVDFKKFLNTRILQTASQGLIFYEEHGMKISEAVEIIKQSLEANVVPDLRTSNPPLFPFTKGGQRGITEKGGKGEFEENFGFTIFVVIGPEGGFIKEEVALAKEKGLLVTFLGERILRAETAAISAVTLVQFLLGDMD